MYGAKYTDPVTPAIFLFLFSFFFFFFQAFLQALSLPAVTNGRASGDYQTPSGNLLGYGVNAPFFAAVGIAPSKDNWWSTPNQPQPPKDPSGKLPSCDGGSRNVTNSFLYVMCYIKY